VIQAAKRHQIPPPKAVVGTRRGDPARPYPAEATPAAPYAVWVCAAQRGGRISSTGCRGGTSPSGRFWRNVVQGSSSSRAQSMFLRK
jgi:hypothetical protein